MVAASGVEDVHRYAAKEVGGGQDDIGSGIGFRSGVLGNGKDVSLEGGKEPMPPPELGGGATMDVEVSGNHVGGEGTVNVGKEVERNRSSGADIDGGAGNGKAREKETKDQVFHGVGEEGLKPNRDLAVVANGNAATRYREGIIRAVKEVGRSVDGEVGLEKGFI